MDQVKHQVPVDIELLVDQMPALSPIVGKLTELTNKTVVSPRELVKVIMLDQVLTARVIQVANLSHNEHCQDIHSLAQAVILLGVNTVRNLAVSTAIRSLGFLRRQNHLVPFNLQAFWRHNLATALATRMLAEVQDRSATELEKFFVAGLMHDLGKVMFIRVLPERYAQAYEESKYYGVKLTFSEMAHLGSTHADVGGLMARKWGLDPKLVEVIERHHEPRMEVCKENPALDLVIIANSLCKQVGLGISGSPVVEEWAFKLAEGLGFSQSLLDEIAGRLPDALKNAAIFLNLPLEGETP